MFHQSTWCWFHKGKGVRRLADNLNRGHMEIWNKLLAFWCSRIPSNLLSKWHVSDGRRQYKAAIRCRRIFLPCLLTNWIQEILDYTQLWNGLNRSFQGALQQKEHIWLWCGEWLCKRQSHWNASIRCQPSRAYLKAVKDSGLIHLGMDSPLPVSAS